MQLCRNKVRTETLTNADVFSASFIDKPMKQLQKIH